MAKEINYIWQARFALKNNWLMAVNILLDAINEMPSDKSLYFELADIYSNRKNFDKAIEIYDKILKLDPTDDYARFKIANCYLSLNEAKLALCFYEEIKEFMPESLYNKAIAYQKLDKNKECISTLNELINLNPTSELPYFFLIEQYLSALKTDKAFKIIEKAEKQFENNPTLHFYKGVCFSYVNKHLNAYNEYRIAEKLNLENPNLLQALGISCSHIGKIEEAIAYFKQAINKNPDTSSAYLELIKILIEKKDFNEAENVVKQLASVNATTAALAKNLLDSFKKK